MSTIDLIILGSLCQSPKSAYDLQKQIETRNLSRWVKVGSFTVYKKVSLYETKGYVTSQTIKNGKMPEKTIYTITQSGKDVFIELMSKFSLTETRVFLDFNAVIVNLSLLDNDSIVEYITNIRNSIQATKAQLSEQLLAQKELSLFGQAILEQQFMLLKALEDWEKNFERQLF
ncbi:MAG: PadR family transcriptional regulator [Oscillospiraceae bacterium]|nr:PadR family transcriptional regulator [Oscillospiraceae bacterium]